MKNKKVKLIIDWSLGLKYFTIYNEIDEKYDIITDRQIDDGAYTCWFNIDNIRREIQDYSKKNNLKLDEKELKNFLTEITEKGLSYSDKNFSEIQKDVAERNSQGIKIKIIE